MSHEGCESIKIIDFILSYIQRYHVIFSYICASAEVVSRNSMSDEYHRMERGVVYGSSSASCRRKTSPDLVMEQK